MSPILVCISKMGVCNDLGNRWTNGDYCLCVLWMREGDEREEVREEVEVDVSNRYRGGVFGIT